MVAPPASPPNAHPVQAALSSTVHSAPKTHKKTKKQKNNNQQQQSTHNFFSIAKSYLLVGLSAQENHAVVTHGHEGVHERGDAPEGLLLFHQQQKRAHNHSHALAVARIRVHPATCTKYATQPCNTRRVGTRKKQVLWESTQYVLLNLARRLGRVVVGGHTVTTHRRVRQLTSPSSEIRPQQALPHARTNGMRYAVVNHLLQLRRAVKHVHQIPVKIIVVNVLSALAQQVLVPTLKGDRLRLRLQLQRAVSLSEQPHQCEQCIGDTLHQKGPTVPLSPVFTTNPYRS